MSETLSNPHNQFFGFAFGQKEHAIGLLRASLSPELTARVDWESLERKPASFVDVRLRGRYSDLLFSIRTLDTVEEVLIYALVEHQSSPHPLMAFRMLRYVVRIWEDHLKAHRDARRLPLVVPLVIYHGRKPWKVARRLRDLIDGSPALIDTVVEHVPRFRYRLIDLQHVGADRLLEELLTAFGKAAMWAMKVYGHDDLVIEGVAQMSEILSKMMAERDGRAALGAFLRYLLATHEQLDERKFRRAIEDAIEPHAGEEVVTVYEQLVEQGRKKGLEQGRAEGRAELLLNQLVAKFGPLPAKVAERVKAASSAELTEWGTRVLTATTLDETLGSPVRKPGRRAAKPGG